MRKNDEKPKTQIVVHMRIEKVSDKNNNKFILN